MTDKYYKMVEDMLGKDALNELQEWNKANPPRFPQHRIGSKIPTDDEMREMCELAKKIKSDLGAW